MIPPRDTWCIQLEVTTACVRACANCTRMCPHRNVEHMDLAVFRENLEFLRDFCTDSPPNKYVNMPSKCIGIIGGEPQLHPEFEAICTIMQEVLPDRMHRGLWTGIPFRKRYAQIIEDTFGQVNHNLHDSPCYHQPILVSSSELLPDEHQNWTHDCWLNKRWSPLISLHGKAYFCEVAATLDELHTGGARGVTPFDRWWDSSLEVFADQLAECCSSCGVAIPLPARRDSDNKDDISPALRQKLHGRLDESRLIEFNPNNYLPANYLKGWEPARYLKDK